MVKESLSRVDLEYDCEMLWLEILSHTRPILLGVFYCPPNSEVSALYSLNCSLLSIHTKSSVVLCGDFNFPHIEHIISCFKFVLFSSSR